MDCYPTASSMLIGFYMPTGLGSDQIHYGLLRVNRGQINHSHISGKQHEKQYCLSTLRGKWHSCHEKSISVQHRDQVVLRLDNPCRTTICDFHSVFPVVFDFIQCPPVTLCRAAIRVGGTDAAGLVKCFLCFTSGSSFSIFLIQLACFTGRAAHMVQL